MNIHLKQICSIGEKKMDYQLLPHEFMDNAQRPRLFWELNHFNRRIDFDKSKFSPY